MSLLGVIERFVFSANITHIIWGAAILCFMILLAVLHHRWKGKTGLLRLWHVLCFVPLTACAVHMWIYVYGFPQFVDGFLPLYLLAVLVLIPAPFARRKIGYRISAAVSGLLSALSGFLLLCTSPHSYNHARDSYTESFHALVQDLDSSYILKEWKGIDFSVLEETYLPAVQAAEAEQNPTKFYDAVDQFCCELHDRHVSVGGGFDVTAFQSETALRTHEYGLSMIQLDSGDVVAVCTTETVRQIGITDGTFITRWNGKPVLQAAEEEVWDRGFPVKANADRLAALYLAGTGGETVEVSYLDASGNEKTVTLSDLGKKHTRSEALLAFRHKPELKTDAEQEAYRALNFSTKMLTDKCGYMMIHSEMDASVPTFWQTITGFLTNWKAAKALFCEKISELKAQGMEYLILDIRNNTGGYGEISMAICETLTNDIFYGEGGGIRKNGQYFTTMDGYVRGTGEFADLPVAALTNYSCVSAGDALAQMLSKLPNVTLCGITDPAGSAQSIGGSSLLSGGTVLVEYPVLLCVDENGEPNIDTRADRVSRNPVEVRIPLDFDAAMTIFRDKEDYELQWALRYLEEHAAG